MSKPTITPKMWVQLWDKLDVWAYGDYRMIPMGEIKMKIQRLVNSALKRKGKKK